MLSVKWCGKVAHAPARCWNLACVAGVNGEGEGEQERERKMGGWALGMRERLLQSLVNFLTVSPTGMT